MSLITGIFNTSLNPAELNMRSFAGTILRLFPNGSAPLFALTSQTPKATAKQSTHGYFSKTMTFITTAANGANADTADTTIQVDSTTGMMANMILHNVRTRENMRVTSVPVSGTVEVQRGFGRVAAAAINDNDVILHVGTAFDEGSQRPGARQLATTYVANYTQIFRNAWGLTDTARASMSEMGYSNIAESRKDCAMFHSTDIEGAILFGQPKMDTTGEQPVHATQGVIDAIYQYASGNVQPASSTTDYGDLIDLVAPAFAYSTDMSNPKERVGFCDRKAIKVITDVGRKSGVVEIMQSETSFGMKFTKFQFYDGTINLVQHPLLNGLQATAGRMLIMDMAALKLAYLEGRDTKAEEYGSNGQTVELGTDGVGGSLTSELAVELINPFACGYVTGLTAGVAEA